MKNLLLFTITSLLMIACNNNQPLAPISTTQNNLQQINCELYGACQEGVYKDDGSFIQADTSMLGQTVTLKFIGYGPRISTTFYDTLRYAVESSSFNWNIIDTMATNSWYGYGNYVGIYGQQGHVIQFKTKTGHRIIMRFQP